MDALRDIIFLDSHLNDLFGNNLSLVLIFLKVVRFLVNVCSYLQHLMLFLHNFNIHFVVILSAFLSSHDTTGFILW
jgi:hypothetical protein